MTMSGCRKDDSSPLEVAGSNDIAEAQEFASETLLYDDVVEPIGKTVQREIFVDNSEPIGPFTKINLIDNSQSTPRVIVSNAIAQEVRWKVKGPFMAPKYPASGFVRLSLAKNQWEALKDKDIIIKKVSSD